MSNTILIAIRQLLVQRHRYRGPGLQTRNAPPIEHPPEAGPGTAAEAAHL